MKFYVYTHVDPDSGNVVYVGKGSAGRAWACGSSTAAPGKRGNRTQAHQAWIAQQLSEGKTPADFVHIVGQALNDKQARKLEAELIAQYASTPLFNRPYGLHMLRVTPEKIAAAAAVRAAGGTWNEAAQVAGVHKMTIWRALTNRTKAITYVK